MGARTELEAARDAAVAQRDAIPAQQAAALAAGMLPLPTAKNWQCCAPGPEERDSPLRAGRRGGPGRRRQLPVPSRPCNSRP